MDAPYGSIPIYEPTEAGGERYKKQRRRDRKPYDERWHGHAWRKPGEPEKYPITTDKFFYQWDTDVLELAKLFVQHYGTGEFKRPIYEASLCRAQQLLKLYKWLDPADGKLKWKLRKDWQQRLIACGIDPKTFQIRNLNRWTRAWEYMKCQYRCPVELIEQDILNGVPAPEYKPFTWSQSLRAQTGRHYNEYGPRPRAGNELISRTWITQIGEKLGYKESAVETQEERRERYRAIARGFHASQFDKRPIPLTET